MSEVIRMFFSGTKMIFNSDSVEIQRNKTVDVKKELRIAKVARKKTTMERTVDRIQKIKSEALS
jgi:hypothetical protein